MRGQKYAVHRGQLLAAMAEVGSARRGRSLQQRTDSIRSGRGKSLRFFQPGFPYAPIA